MDQMKVSRLHKNCKLDDEILHFASTEQIHSVVHCAFLHLCSGNITTRSM